MSALDYLQEYSSRGTVQSYRRGVARLFEVVHPEQLVSQGLEATADSYIAELREGRAAEKDVKALFASSKSAVRKTVALWLSAIRVIGSRP